MNPKSLQQAIAGKKTYIVAGLMVLVAIVNIVSGDSSLSSLLKSDDLRLLLEGLGVGALRLGISKTSLTKQK